MANIKKTGKKWDSTALDRKGMPSEVSSPYMVVIQTCDYPDQKICRYKLPIFYDKSSKDAGKEPLEYIKNPSINGEHEIEISGADYDTYFPTKDTPRIKGCYQHAEATVVDTDTWKSDE